MIRSKTLRGVYSVIIIVMATSVSQFAVLSLKNSDSSIRQSILYNYFRSSPSNNVSIRAPAPVEAIVQSVSTEQEPSLSENNLLKQKIFMDAVYGVLSERPAVEIFNAATPILNETREKPKPVIKEEIVEKTVTAPKKEDVKAAVVKQPAEKPKQTKAEYQRPLPEKTGIFTSRFGKRTLNGQTRLHAGIDIAAPKGSPIYAAKEGRITRAGWASGYGLLIEIEHPNGTFTRYAHCSKLLMKAGDKVNQGTEIAQVGSTGRSTGSHLHFEIIKNGKPVNPYGYVKW